MACAQRIDTRLVDIKADNRALFTKLDRERQTNVAEANDREFDVFQFVHAVIRIALTIYRRRVDAPLAAPTLARPTVQLNYSTVTDLARLRGLSTSVPLIRATW